MPGKSVLITGTSTGIGRAAAGMLAAKGYRVLATMRSPEKGRDLAEEAKANGWDLGVVPEAVVPTLAILLAIPATILVANLLAVIPGRVASRLRPGPVLRTE